MYLPGATIKLSRAPARVGPVPAPGQHTDAVLTDVLGYDQATIKALRDSKAIA
jgi:crotonobetainyl-CoA:carnitine CoA-transferase CaiB-like acyl-CoA transferase